MRRRVLNLLILGAMVALAVPTARETAAALANRYSFTGNLNDSVGGANGTMVDVGAPTAVFSGGQLDLSANTGEGSNGITEDAYVDLPNGMITTAATGGTSGALSIELWATIAEQHTWMRFVDFGTSDGGEDTSGGAGNSPYIYLAANSGRFNNGLSTEAHEPNGPLREIGVAGPAPLNTQIHLVGSYDQNDLSAGTNGTFKLYNNGGLVGTAALPPNLNLNTFTNDNNWIGRSQWNDPAFDGKFNEFRIYNHALTASEAGANSILGPDTVTGDIIKLEVNKNTGNVRLVNATTQTLNLDFYRVSSAMNALSTASWSSLDDQNFLAVDGPGDADSIAGNSPGEGFDESGAIGAGQLVEYYLGAAGAPLTAGQSVSLGNAFNTSVFGNGNNGDLQLKFGLVGGLEINGSVSYVTGGKPGDFDGDTDVDGADFLVWQRGVGTTHNAATLALWKANFATAIGATGAVPEPATCCLIASAIAGIAVARRRNG